MRAVWSLGRASARELHEASAEATGWSLSATRKTLDRMVEKGALRTQTVHGVKTFAAARPRLETLADLIRGFAVSLLGADRPPAAAAFVGTGLVTRDEVEELEALLRDEQTP
ncbi:putative transcriptional regulator [Parvularcula dongshanensis]|uniref:Putative transcriptional regulator n=2 Tax=Parvularcula dongshanensis TaxID=1173995 RepID=A0A840I2E0_9PROT|nr:putative transcriptional regulator [Parvularcula dongshanensis]